MRATSLRLTLVTSPAGVAPTWSSEQGLAVAGEHMLEGFSLRKDSSTSTGGATSGAGPLAAAAALADCAARALCAEGAIVSGAGFARSQPVATTAIAAGA